MERMLQQMMAGGGDPTSFLDKLGVQMKARQTPQGIIRSNRQLIMEQGCYDRSLPLLKKAMTPLLNSGKDESYPAVDLAAGSCVYTVAWAQHFRQPRYKSSLEWYPTDYTGQSHPSSRPTEGRDGPLEDDLRNTLRFLTENSDVLFADKNGIAIFAGDSIKLEGLRSQQYNDLHGVVVSADPQAEGRFEVQLGEDMDWKACSFKAGNIRRVGDWMGSENVVKFDEAEEYAADRKRLLGGMLDRSCELDILRESTWSNLAPIYGKCALVTCTNLLCCLGYRNPEAWKDCLMIAARLLRPGGIFMAEDDIVDGFGNHEAMQEFVQGNQLELEVTLATMTDDGSSVKLVWKKV
mmetsp:Transcript_5898/g.16601  ORF Transcript_5898/g.16601 Transcript_5898/m.16601 type:complete len:350 (-) Transcript_5898:588-1637(-)